MASSAEMLWIDVLEHEEAGEREEALELAQKITRIEPDHTSAWRMVARMTLPPQRRGQQEMPTLAQAATALGALRRVVQLEPDDRESWILGGILLVDHLGMLEEALVWWQERRVVEPSEVTPLVEQIAILVRLGMYTQAGELLEVLFSEGMESPDSRQLVKMDQVRKMVEKAAKMEKDEVFRPQNPKHPRWEIIDRMKARKPLSETFFLFTFVAPIVFLIGTVAMQLLGGTQYGFILVFLIILGLFMGVSRMGSGLLHSLNRHALDLDRALDVEATSGMVCVPDGIRGSKLYEHLLGKRPEGFRERHERIVDADEKLKRKWKPVLPDFSSVGDESWWGEGDESGDDSSDAYEDSDEPLELDELED